MVLELRNISKRFPGVVALDDVSIGFAKGEVHALAGENGAGKSTLIKVIAGRYRPDEGRILFHEKGGSMKRRISKTSLIAPDIAALSEETIHKIAFAMPWASFSPRPSTRLAS